MSRSTSKSMRKRPDTGALPNCIRFYLQAATLVRWTSRTLLELAIGIARSFIGGRHGVYYDLHTWRRYVSAAGFVELSHYYRPACLRRERQPWLASVWRDALSHRCRYRSHRSG